MVKTTFAEKMLAIDHDNRQAAEIILAAPHLHGGLGSLGSVGAINSRTLSGKPR